MRRLQGLPLFSLLGRERAGLQVHCSAAMQVHCGGKLDSIGVVGGIGAPGTQPDADAVCHFCGVDVLRDHVSGRQYLATMIATVPAVPSANNSPIS